MRTASKHGIFQIRIIRFYQNTREDYGNSDDNIVVFLPFWFIKMTKISGGRKQKMTLLCISCKMCRFVDFQIILRNKTKCGWWIVMCSSVSQNDWSYLHLLLYVGVLEVWSCQTSHHLIGNAFFLFSRTFSVPSLCFLNACQLPNVVRFEEERLLK